jgi:hypothetical protein
MRESSPFAVAMETHIERWRWRAAVADLRDGNQEGRLFDCRQLSGKLDQPELLQRGDAVVEPDFLGDLAVFQL